MFVIYWYTASPHTQQNTIDVNIKIYSLYDVVYCTVSAYYRRFTFSIIPAIRIQCMPQLPLYRLKEIAAVLRSEHGCAWDKAQTSDTLKPYLIEEAYEVYQAIEKDNDEHLKEELGDLLYQIYAHAQIAVEQNRFTIDDIAQTAINKLIRRHPHVFGGDTIHSKEEIIDRWEKIKREEKTNGESILEGVPSHLPALLKSYRIQQKVSRIGFDWDTVNDIVVKLSEEINEFAAAFQNHPHDRKALMEEIGDILFTIANIARHVEINPEEALQFTNAKFVKRFQYIERRLHHANKDISAMTLAELDSLWDESKDKE